MKSLGYHSASAALNTAKSFADLTAPGGLPNAKNLRVLLCVETQPVRFRCDGTNPTAADGHLLAVGEKIWLENDLANVRLIATAAGARITFEYFRTG